MQFDHVKGYTGKFMVDDQCSSDSVDYILQHFDLDGLEFDIGMLDPINISYELLNRGLKVRLFVSALSLLRPKLWHASLIQRLPICIGTPDHPPKNHSQLHLHYNSGFGFYGIKESWMHYIVSGENAGGHYIYDGFAKVINQYAPSVNFRGWEIEDLYRRRSIVVEVSQQ